MSADAAGDVEFGANRHTGLANLTVVVSKAGIHGSTAGAYLGVQLLGQFEQHVEAFFRAHAIAAGYDDGRSFQVVFGLLHVAVDDLHYIVRLVYILGHVVVDNLALVVLVQDFFLHHAFADGGHLRTVFGVDDGGYDVAAESRADLVEQVLIRLALFLVLVVADFQGGAVGGQSAGQGRRYAGTQVAADDRGAHQADLRLLFLEQVDEDGRVRQGGVGKQARCVKHVQLVHTVGHHLLFDAGQA